VELALLAVTGHTIFLVKPMRGFMFSTISRVPASSTIYAGCDKRPALPDA